MAYPLLVYGVGQGFTLPSLVTLVVGSSRISAADAGSALGVFAMVQQVALALGVAVVGGVFFGALGGATTRAAYDGALAAALTCNLGLLAATFALVLGLPRALGATAQIVPTCSHVPRMVLSSGAEPARPQAGDGGPPRSNGALPRSSRCPTYASNS